MTLGSNQTFIDYDLIGNITRKTDVSPDNWSYHGTKKHAVTATGTGGPTYSYDANGNVATRNGATLSWTAFNLPSVINGSGVSSQFWYGPDRQRFKQVANFTTGTETTHYVGGVLEKLVTTSNTHYRHLIAGPTGLVAIYTRRVSGTPLEDTFYFTHDHLGSVDSITQADGTVQVRLSYDAFGKRRNEAGWSGGLPSPDWTGIANSSRRGYTEHEHLDNLGLIHMNGRVQDPLIGRFLSADPLVPDPFDGQSFNRYSYVRNNPLSRVDPTGFDDDCLICIRITWDLASGRGVFSDVYGKGVLSYSNAVTAGLMSEPGRGPDTTASDPGVAQFNQQTEQVKKAVSESANVAGSPEPSKGGLKDPQSVAIERVREAVAKGENVPLADLLSGAELEESELAEIAEARGDVIFKPESVTDALSTGTFENVGKPISVDRVELDKTLSGTFSVSKDKLVLDKIQGLSGKLGFLRKRISNITITPGDVEVGF